MARPVWTASALLLIPGLALAASPGIEHRCTTKYPSILQYFAWKDCVQTATQEELEEQLKRQIQEEARQREEQARPCVAADIGRMEGLPAKARAVVKPEWILEQVQLALDPILEMSGQIQVPGDNIKERVLVYSISTKCDASFRS